MKGRREIRREDEFVETVGGSGKWKANAEGEWETDACEATAARLKGERVPNRIIVGQEDRDKCCSLNKII